MSIVYATTASGQVARFSYPGDERELPEGYDEITQAEAEAAIDAAFAAVNDTDETAPDDIAAPIVLPGAVFDYTAAIDNLSWTPAVTGNYIVRHWARVNMDLASGGWPAVSLFIGTTDGGSDILDTSTGVPGRSAGEQQTTAGRGLVTNERDHMLSFEAGQTYWFRLVPGIENYVTVDTGNVTIVWSHPPEGGT